MPKKIQKPVVKKEEKKEAPVAATSTASAPVAPAPAKRGKGTPELLRGFRDIFGDEQPYWERIRTVADSLCRAYSFTRIELPLLEREELFVRTVGRGTDIVEKEMYVFEDPGGDRVALRPEATASVARAYINHGMLNLPQPVKLFYWGAMLRHDRPQAGRYRQFHQLGLEVLGSNEAIIDAQLIVIAYRLCSELGLDVTVQINSIGSIETRRQYAMELTRYFRPYRNQFSEDDKRRLQKNPLRLLDSKEEYMPELLANAPQIMDFLDEDSKNHFMQVIEFLDAAEVTYALVPTLVRGLDYYGKTVFEVVPTSDDGSRAQNSLGGGGRYDGLVEILGGRPTAACGFAMGLERLVLAMKEQHVSVERRRVQVFFAQLGDAARRAGLKLYEELRQNGLEVAEAFGKGSLKAQLELANELVAPYTLIVGQKEVLDGTVIIRDMESGAQEIADAGKIVSILKRKLEARKELPAIPVGELPPEETVGEELDAPIEA